jgi:GNAT superfamily N-acetyltransferase
MASPLELRPMRPAELEEFMDQHVRDRARNAAFALGLDSTFSLKRARDEVNAMLKDGLSTPNHFLYRPVLGSDRVSVGWVWYSLEARGTQMHALLHELRIVETHRRMGLGRKVMSLIEDRARKAGAAQIHSLAFTHNLRARELMQKLGYQPVQQLYSRKL